MDWKYHCTGEKAELTASAKVLGTLLKVIVVDEHAVSQENRYEPDSSRQKGKARTAKAVRRTQECQKAAIAEASAEVEEEEKREKIRRLHRQERRWRMNLAAETTAANTSEA